MTVPGRKKTPDRPDVQEHGRRLGALIRDQRNLRQMSRAVLAHGSSVSPQQLANLETGKVGDPGFLLVARVAEVLDLGLDYLHRAASGHNGGRVL
jgi:transcriptional regulator with XRE-family HTH domain